MSEGRVMDFSPKSTHCVPWDPLNLANTFECHLYAKSRRCQTFQFTIPFPRNLTDY